MRERVANELQSMQFATPMMNGWNKLVEEVFEAESVGEFKGK